MGFRPRRYFGWRVFEFGPLCASRRALARLTRITTWQTTATIPVAKPYGFVSHRPTPRQAIKFRDNTGPAK
jgi:hypothetical protein